MKTAILLAAALTILSACNYARMIDDEAVDLYQEEMPETPAESIPIGGGLNALLLAEVEKLENPLPDDPAVARHGEQAYNIYCQQCHGPEAMGFGTVGQSFAPLPTNLHSKYVQEQSDGRIYARITLGYKRHPPMYWTVSDANRWALVRFIRSLGKS